MAEPLVCEDSKLDRLLSTVASKPGARILYQDRVRRGGIFGFFTKEVHRVAYELTGDTTQPTASVDLVSNPDDTGPTPSTEVDSAELDSAAAGLEQLLASADALETCANDVPPTPTQDFAAVLSALAATAPSRGDTAPSDNAVAAPEPSTAQPTATSQPVPAAQPVVARALIDVASLRGDRIEAGGLRDASVPRTEHTARPDARARLDLLMQLRQIGVPVSVNPRGEAHTLYEALEEILTELPAPAEPPRAAGSVLALVGDAIPTLTAARTVAATLRIPESTVAVAGLSELVTGAVESAAGVGYRVPGGASETGRLRTELMLSESPSIVVLATDGADANPHDPWVVDTLAALRPSTVWAVLDARWKIEDCRALLGRLGRVDGIVVHSAQLSGSPASVWDLDVPVALLDGRPATTFAWAGLLLSRLGADARHRATA